MEAQTARKAAQGGKKTRSPHRTDPANPMDESAQRYRLSDHIHEYPLEDGGIAIWNSFWPRPKVVSPQALDALRRLPADADKWPPAVLTDLAEAHIVHTGEEDTSESDFFASADKWIAKIDREAEEFEANGGVYRNLALVNSGCNLGCSYCVSYFGDEGRENAKREALRGAEREEAVIRVVRAYLTNVRDSGTRMEDDDRHHCRLSFNGGEILLRWTTVKRVVELADREFPELDIYYHMNTNATLLKPEIAEFLAKHEFKVSVSIDGYEELHDESRVYHGGAGSFDHVMRGVENYRRANDNPTTLRGFQGTIENIDGFDFEKLFTMSEKDFVLARLAPNVLDHADNPQRGRDAAYWEAQLVTKSQGRRLGVGGTEFENRLKRAAHGIPFGYRANCGGLDGVTTKTITLNMDSMQAGQLCSFTSPASMPMESGDGNIDHRALYAATRNYLAERVEVVKTTCNGCSVVGICQGGCVYNALDVYNRKNPAGCAYQRALWRHAIDFNETTRVRKYTDASEDAMSVRVRAAQEAGGEARIGCGSHAESEATPVALLSGKGETLVAAPARDVRERGLRNRE